jgi:hypothetical protein
LGLLTQGRWYTSLAILIAPVGSLVDRAGYRSVIEDDGKARHKTRWR